jgi:CRP-like cAMP-binding protein
MSNIVIPTRNLWLPDVVENFSSIATRTRYREGAVLFWAGDDSNRVFFVEEGIVQIYHYTEDGVIVPLLSHQRGEMVGIGGILSGTERNINARTLRPSVLWEVNRPAFFQLLHDYPDVTIWVATSLSDRLRITDQEVLRAVAMPSDRRIAISLLDLTQRDETVKNEDGSLRVQITHQELAQIVGICRQTVTT